MFALHITCRAILYAQVYFLLLNKTCRVFFSLREISENGKTTKQEHKKRNKWI